MGELVDVYRNSVQTWECDQMGHMNVQFYLDKADAGLLALTRMLGLDRRFLNERQARVRVLENHVRFLREQHAGSPLTLRAGLIDIRPDQLKLYFELTNPIQQAVAASFITQAVLESTAGKDHLTLPQSALEKAQQYQIDWPRPEGPMGLESTPPRTPPTLQEADNLGMIPTYLGPVSAGMCDADGHLAIRSYMGIVSDAVPHLLSRIRHDTREVPRPGGAALEYRWIYHQRPKQGDLVTLRSAITHLGNKAYRLGHWLFDAETGHCLATTEAVAVMMDLDERKALVIPQTARASLEEMLVKGFSI